MNGLTTHRLVHYVNDLGIHESAVVEEVYDKDARYVSLRNFADQRLCACTYSEKHEKNTWHWPEKAQGMTEAERYQAVQANIRDLLDKAANDKSAGGMVGLGSVWLAAELFAKNEQVHMKSGEQQDAQE